MPLRPQTTGLSGRNASPFPTLPLSGRDEPTPWGVPGARGGHSGKAVPPVTEEVRRWLQERFTYEGFASNLELQEHGYLEGQKLDLRQGHEGDVELEEGTFWINSSFHLTYETLVVLRWAHSVELENHPFAKPVGLGLASNTIYWCRACAGHSKGFVVIQAVQAHVSSSAHWKRLQGWRPLAE